MANPRNARLNEDLKREIIAIISLMKDPRLQKILTVTRVEIAPDLTTGKVYISVLEGDKACEEALSVLRKGQGFIRGELSKKLRIRRSPELTFIKDDGVAYALKINELLKEIKDE